jgi:catechol 2,3-dioxygenase-like lactoylglutathione lyase family enzyme
MRAVKPAYEPGDSPMAKDRHPRSNARISQQTPRSTPMLDHVSLNVSNPAKAKEFYSKALAPLGYSVTKEYDGGFGIQADGGSSVWTVKAKVEEPVHLGFRVNDRKQVDAFYKAAIAAGGKDNGKPGIREKYASDYYAAFVLDPDGNNVEAVCHGAK